MVGAAITVLNELGHGLHEKPYGNALVVEFGLRHISFNQQCRFDVPYKGARIGEYIPDLITHDAVVVDTKVIDRITNHERGQMLNYLRITKLRVGLILKFQERQARMGAHCPVNKFCFFDSCKFVSISGLFLCCATTPPCARPRR